MDSDVIQEPALFRPTKRRKFLRSRPRSDDGTSRDAPFPSTGADLPDDESDLAERPAVADIARLRKAHRGRKNGIEFSNSRSAPANGPSESNALTTTNPEADRLKAISDRFVGHTGQVVDVNKHMVAYIESEMAKRHHVENPPTLSSFARAALLDSNQYESESSEEDSTQDRKIAQKQPASLGKIHEIDLGQDVSLRNAQRTEAALRRRNGEPVPSEERPIKIRKPRIGRDGKPMKPRPRKRRNSEDIKRDQLVEQVLRESRLEIYDEPEPENLDDLEADDRVAEKFRQDFIDAMQSRKRNRTSGQPKPPAGKAAEQGPKGPKLGGSRSARAAMREMQEKKTKK